MKKIGILVLVLTLALGAIGIGYAAWTQSLQINGTVNSGTFDVRIVGTAVVPGTGTPATYSTVTYGSNPGVDDGDNCPLSITIDLAVPGTYTIPLTIYNDSTIAVKIAYSGISNTLPSGSTVTGGPTATTIGAGLDDGGTNLVVYLPDSMPRSGASYTFTVPIDVTQGD